MCVKTFSAIASDYHPYGSILRQHINGAQEKYLTTHHERDLETGLDYRGARYYDSDVARFLSLDPLAADYASWSPYNYVMGDPVSLVDPDGRACGCPPPCAQVVSNLEYAWHNAVYKMNQVVDRTKAGVVAIGEWINEQRSDGGYTLTSDYAKGSNNADRKGRPSGSLDATAVEARANATNGPEKLSPVKSGLAGEWMENLHDIVSGASGAVQELLEPTPTPLIVSPDRTTESSSPTVVRVDTFYIRGASDGKYRTPEHPEGEYKKAGDTLDISIQSTDANGNVTVKTEPYRR
ncbi:MAG: RHS repeat-associated core domain-containing protein [Flavobacteriales bacterium]